MDNWRRRESGFAKYWDLALTPLFLGFTPFLFDSYLAVVTLSLFPKKGQILQAFIRPEVTGTFWGEWQIQNQQLQNYNWYLQRVKVQAWFLIEMKQVYVLNFGEGKGFGASVVKAFEIRDQTNISSHINED